MRVGSMVLCAASIFLALPLSGCGKRKTGDVMAERSSATGTGIMMFEKAGEKSEKEKKKTTPCVKCGGAKTITCMRCNGQRTLRCPPCFGGGQVEVNCKSCGGTGNRGKCKPCGGTGDITETCIKCSGRGTLDCGRCGATGTETCNLCGGTGENYIQD